MEILLWFWRKYKRSGGGGGGGGGRSSSFVDSCICDDILVEILCRLPPKDITRYKSVSKSWSQLISDICIPRINSTISGFFVLTNYNFEHLPTWVYTRQGESTYARYCSSLLPGKLDSHNMLACSNGCALFFHPSSLQFHVCNPTLKQYVAIPLPPQRIRNPRFLGKSAGLTFDDNLHTYYVVHLMRYPLRVYVYSSLTHDWNVHTHLYLPLSILDKQSTVWSQDFVFLGQSFYKLSSSGHLLKFGFIHNNGATAIKLPQIVVVTKDSLGSCGVSQSRLHYAWVDDHRQLKIWMLDENGGDWVMKHTLFLQDLEKRVPFLRMLYFYSFHPTSDVLLLGHDSSIFSYQPTTNTMDHIFLVRNFFSICHDQLFIFPFSHNLVSLDGFSSSTTENKVGGSEQDGVSVNLK